MFKRIHLVVLDSVGIGEAPDAEKFGDVGSHTLGHIAEHGLHVPNMEELGLGTIEPLKGVKAIEDHKGYATKLEEVSVGKDTMTGHWEIAGLNIQTPFRVFPEGFPQELLDKITEFSGRGIIMGANKPYSGTQVIEDFGEEQMKTGDLIIYTSADPVLQIAAHEDVIPLEELYKICEYTRDITKDDPYMIGRIIARPYLGEPGNFKRTANRHDYALDPFGRTVLNELKDAGLDVMKQDFEGVSFTNLVDFDALFGHRRDTPGYAKALEEFDARLPEIYANMQEDDLLLITADHGNDPTFPGTDHTREYVPLLAYSKKMQEHGQLPQGYYSDISATIADNFDVKPTENGKSFLELLK